MDVSRFEYENMFCPKYMDVDEKLFICRKCLNGELKYTLPLKYNKLTHYGFITRQSTGKIMELFKCRCSNCHNTWIVKIRRRDAV